jgi:hypothetical protein
MAVQFVIRITFLLLLTYGLAEAAPPIGKSDCQNHCGNVTNIPYPFGIGSSQCYMDDWFEIVCNRSGAFLKRINMEVLEISIQTSRRYADNTVLVKSPIISSNPSCTSMSSGGGVNMKGSPFTFSVSNNFISVGCDNSAIMTETDPMIIGCKSNCDTSLINDKGNTCSGYNCCEATIPSGLQTFNVSFPSTDDKKGQEGCRYAFLAEEEWLYNISLPFSVEKIDFIPAVVLDWRIYNWTKGSLQMFESFTNRQGFACRLYSTPGSNYEYYSYESKVIKSTNFSKFGCWCVWGYEGNPYLPTGCEGKFRIYTCIGFLSWLFSLI